jgi:hypothetical protein
MRNRLLFLLCLQIATLLSGVVLAARTQPATHSPVHSTAVPTTATFHQSTASPVTRVAPTRRVTPQAPPVRRAASSTPHKVRQPSPRESDPRVPRPLRRSVPAATPQQRLDMAVARIPAGRTGPLTWVLYAKDGYWGTADWYHDVIWISPRVPAHRMYDVVVHEWSHIASVRPYGGDVDLATQEMRRYFGGAGLIGAERAADCMALLLGARWTNYTSCHAESWRQGAARLLTGRRL